MVETETGVGTRFTFHSSRALSTRHPYPCPTLAAVYRTLAPHVHGMLHWSVGMQSALTSALTYDDQHTAARLEFKVRVETKG